MNYNELPYPQQKKALIRDVNKFVHHTFIVYKNTKVYDKHTHKVLRKIDQVKNAVYAINAYIDLLTICKKIYALRNDLELILPHPANKSYPTSRERLNDMVTFCSIYIRSKTRKAQYA